MLWRGQNKFKHLQMVPYGNVVTPGTNAIQNVVDKIAASGLNSDTVGATILVAPGTYTETLTLEDDALYNLSFIAIGGPNSVILDPASGGTLKAGATIYGIEVDA